MTSSKIYLDNCIFVACIHEKHKYHDLVLKALEAMEKIDFEVYSSEWALIELVKVLIREYNYPKNQAEGIADNFRTKCMIKNIPIKWVEVNTNKEIGFKEFFEYLKNQLLEVSNIHLADALHSLIMSNNGIDNILTTDEKFNVLDKVNSIHPRVLAIIKPKDGKFILGKSQLG